jgi:hypothetical protein
MSEVYSDYWQCEECGAVLYSPTTGRADGVQCWKCNGAPVVLSLQPTRWRPITKPTPLPTSAYARWCVIRKQSIGQWSDKELAAADIAVAMASGEQL